MRPVKQFGYAAPMLLSTAVNADVNSDLNDFFGKLGFETNTTMPHAWRGQAAAGYASGGSIYMRTAVKQVQLFSMQVPLNAGAAASMPTWARFPISPATSSTVRQTDRATLPGTFSIWPCKPRCRK